MNKRDYDVSIRRLPPSRTMQYEVEVYLLDENGNRVCEVGGKYTDTRWGARIAARRLARKHASHVDYKEGYIIHA